MSLIFIFLKVDTQWNTAHTTTRQERNKPKSENQEDP